MAENQIRVMRVIARMNVGGPAIQISGLARNLDHERFDQRIYAGICDADERDYAKEVAKDVVIHHVPGLSQSINPIKDLRASFYLIRQIRAFEPDIIHTHTFKAGFVGRIAALMSFKDVKIVHTFHGHILHGYFSPAVNKFIIAIERYLAKKSDVLIAVGEVVRDDLLSARIGYPEQYQIVPPGLVFNSSKSKAEARAELDLKPKDKVISFIGRITKIKRVDRFLDVVELLQKSEANLKVLIAGEGDLFPQMKEIAKQRDLSIQWLGWVDDVEPIIQASDLVVLTSDNEGTPISLIQAALAGVPVVATDVGSVSDVVLDRVTGVLCELDSRVIARAVEELLLNSSLRENLGLAARINAQKVYGVNRLAKDHEEIYSLITADEDTF
jgi:glycosyltransferase involved in cell wall biosynthesis